MMVSVIDAPKLVWGAADWTAVVAGIAVALLVLLVVGYWRAGSTPAVRLLAGAVKTLAILLLALCLLEPLFSGQRARPGANQFAVLADNSQSMTLKDAGKTRGEQLKTLAGKPSPWLAQLGRDFDLRQYSFDTQLHNVDGFDSLAFDGRSSDIGGSLDRLLRRYQGRPLAGVLLFTDGSATDAAAAERLIARASATGAKVPPIYPVVVGADNAAGDVSVERVAVTQTNFEDAPVTLTAHLGQVGQRGQTLVAELLDEQDKPVERQTIRVVKDGEPLALRFRVRPTSPGLSFYKVRVAAEGQPGQFEKPETSAEATLANNTRVVAVDRKHGPYRILYVGGRPNWEFKFLNRALTADDQVQLIGLLRLAKREPKFTFLGNKGDGANPLFKGFENKDRETSERHDQPVLMRVNTLDQDELKAGFPKDPEELYKYHAIVIDDLEAEFFSQDQMQLLKDFVRQRGGGLLMLGGQETFKNGRYDKTPIGDLLPVYADQVQDFPPDTKHRLALTREGWLEPWIRLRADEVSERQRLEQMPSFEVVNPVRGIKPGATILASVVTEAGVTVPALVEQHFGRGRTAALLIGDFWRWHMRRPVDTESDMEKAWRQTIRWLVAEVPTRVEIAVQPRRDSEDAEDALIITTTVRDPAYAPLDNAAVTIKVTGPDNKPVDLRAEPSKDPGRYAATYVPRPPGAYRAEVIAKAPDGSDIGRTQTGWTSDPAAEEFRVLKPDVELLNRLAKATGGEVVKADNLERFVATLPTRHADITEPYVRPLWHQSWVFLLAIACLAFEWGLRRIKGLP